jgi:hypothetical protein
MFGPNTKKGALYAKLLQNKVKIKKNFRTDRKILFLKHEKNSFSNIGCQCIDILRQQTAIAHSNQKERH